MEFLYTHSMYRYNRSSPPQKSSPEMRKKVGLLTFDDKPFKEAHIVFNTRDLTKSITEITKTPPKPDAPKSNSAVETETETLPKPSEPPCLLATHGVRRNKSEAAKPGQIDSTLNLLPLTVCTEHGKASFLPMDYVKRMGEYTRTTIKYPIYKVVHRFDDCVLEFPHPPPIGSSEERGLKLDRARNCYQCSTELSHRKNAYTYRDYVFCCHGCRMRARVTRYWYKMVMKTAEDGDGDGDGDGGSSLERKRAFAFISQ